MGGVVSQLGVLTTLGAGTEVTRISDPAGILTDPSAPTANSLNLTI